MQKSFKDFLIMENPMMGGMPPGSDGGMGGMGGAPLGADPMGGGMGAPPMGGPMDPMGGGMGAPPMGGAGGQAQVPVHIKDPDVWKILDHIFNKTPLPKEPEQPQTGNDPMAQMPQDPMGGGMSPMNEPMPGQQPGAPSPMGGPPSMSGLMS